MTPQEKAQELIDKYLPEVRGADRYNYNLEEINVFIAKQCALIAVNEVLANIDATILYNHEIASIPLNKSYWSEVKNLLIMTPTQTHKALTPAGEWVAGWFDYSDQTSPTIWMKDKPTGIPETVLPETVCRATGRTDSNGKMMYEGDFVQVDEVQVDEWINGMEGYSGIYRIEYNTVDCAFLLVDDRDMITRAIRFNEMDTYTLTGKNIHDKPSVE